MRLPRRAAEPISQHTSGLGHRHPRLEQLRGRIDPPGVIASVNTTPTTRHAINVLLDMSRTARNTPRPLNPPVAQRDIKLEVAQCVGGVLSPLLANIALHGLDEHLQNQWRQTMGNEYRRTRRRRLGLGTWRVVRYADDFVVLVFGSRENVESLRDEMVAVLAEMGLRLSPTKTQIRHMSEGFDFLGFHIQWRRKFGTDKWHIYTFIADRPIRQLKDKIRALTRRTSQQNLRDVLIRLGLIMRGWANYFKHAVCKHVFRKLAALTWWRVIKWQMQLRRWKWKDVRRWLTTPDGVGSRSRRTGSRCSTSRRCR
jgi:hypothetical protein